MLRIKGIVVSPFDKNMRVYFNSEIGVEGTEYPKGTPSFPVSSFEEAQKIVNERIFHERIKKREQLLKELDD